MCSLCNLNLYYRILARLKPDGATYVMSRYLRQNREELRIFVKLQDRWLNYHKIPSILKTYLYNIAPDALLHLLTTGHLMDFKFDQSFCLDAPPSLMSKDLGVVEVVL